MTIKQIQNLLQYLGYYNGEITGTWSESYQDAIIAFQDDFGAIAVDGIAEAETQKALRHAVAYGMPVYEVKSKPESGDFWDDIEFFTREEFRCQCYKYHGTPYCDGYPAEPKEQLVRIADQLRRNLGAPVTIISGLRCRQHNADQPGAAVNSQHMYGEAADIYVKGKTQAQVEAELDKIGGVRYHYPIEGTSNVHFDIPKGAR